MTRPDPGAATRPVVLVVGLGPAGPGMTTVDARAALEAAPVVLLRTGRHPAAEPLLAGGARALDHHYEESETFEETYAGIVEEVVSEATARGRVAYAVPGSPLVLESTVRALLADDRVEVELVAGMSFLELAWERLRVDPVAERVRLIDAGHFARDAAGDTGPLLVGQLWSQAVLSEVKLSVETFPTRPVVVLHHLGLADERVFALDWSELDRAVEADHLTCLWIPELAAPVASELVRLDELVHVLRLRCPWDRDQTHASLARHLLEEAYEAVDAIDGLGDLSSATAVEHLEEELGDVLCQVFYHCVLAGEEGLFTMADVARATHDKLVGRHPHVFGEAVADDIAQVTVRWEQLKQAEKGRESITEGIPAALPALALAAKLERKAASARLGWAVTGAPVADVKALLVQVLSGGGAGSARTVSDEQIGMLLLWLSRFAASVGVDSEDALRRAANAFRDRLRAAERNAIGLGMALLESDDAARRLSWDGAEPR